MMKVDFTTALDVFSVGDAVAVSNRQPEPPVQGTLVWNQWRSRNHSGTITAKDEASITVELPKVDGVRAAYTLTEDDGVRFEAADRQSLDIVTLRRLAVMRIDAERVRVKSALFTTGCDYFYSEKVREVLDFKSITSVILAALTLQQRRERWPFAQAEVEVRGGSLADAVARFETGMSARQSVAKMEAEAQKAKAAIAAAQTRAAVIAACEAGMTAMNNIL